MTSLKINNEIFDVVDGSIQLSTGSHATIICLFDIEKNPSYEGTFIDLYEKNSYFRIESNRYYTTSTCIKALDLDFLKRRMSISFYCETLTAYDKSLRREEIIESLFDKPSN